MLFPKLPHFFHGGNRPVAAGDHGDIRQLCLGTGIDLVTEHDQVLHPGTDKDKSFLGAAFCQLGIFRKETVTGMDGVYIMLMGDAHNIFNIQISLYRAFAPAYQVRFIGFVAMQGQSIFLGKNRNGTNTQLVTGAEHADGDLAPVGNQNRIDLSHSESSLDQMQEAAGTPARIQYRHIETTLPEYVAILYYNRFTNSTILRHVYIILVIDGGFPFLNCHNSFTNLYVFCRMNVL